MPKTWLGWTILPFLAAAWFLTGILVWNYVLFGDPFPPYGWTRAVVALTVITSIPVILEGLKHET